MATILLVDDEKIVRTLLALALRRQNHHVLEAGTGHSALRAVRKAGVRVDLLVSELCLPKMSALELAAKLSDVAPGCRTLLLSRSPHPIRLEERARGVGYSVLREPCDFRTVLGEVAHLVRDIDQRKPPGSSEAPGSGKRAATNGSS